MSLSYALSVDYMQIQKWIRNYLIVKAASLPTKIKSFSSARSMAIFHVVFLIN